MKKDSEKENKKSEEAVPSAPPELTDRNIYNTPIGPVCMSKAEYQAYQEELEARESQE